MADSMRLAIASFACVISLMLALGIFGPHVQAQARDPNWVNLAIEVTKNSGRISHVESFVTRLEDAKLPERIAKIESNLEWTGNMLKAILGILSVLLGDIALRVFRDNRKPAETTPGDLTVIVAQLLENERQGRNQAQ